MHDAPVLRPRGERQTPSSIRALCALLFVLIVVQAVPALAGSSALGTVISNIATVTWEQGGTRVATQSNRVDVVRVVRALPASVTLFHFSNAAGSSPLEVSAALCTAAGPAALSPAWRAQSLTPGAVMSAEQIRIGEPLVFRVEDPSRNTDSGLAETITVRVRADSGDQELLQVTETGPATGVFVAFVQTMPRSAGANNDDCRLAVQTGDRVSVDSLAADQVSVTASASLRVLADPLGLVFDSVTGAVINGARVTLIDMRTGQPASVFGDDGVSTFPSTITTGSTVSDSAGMAYLLAPGAYRFPLVSPGTYTLRIEPPAPYTAPSVRTPAELAALRAPDGRAFVLSQASYGASFVLDGPEPVEVSVPVDGPRGPLEVEKTANKTTATPGDLVVFSVTVHNADANLPARNVRLTDDLPADLRLTKSSVELDGKPIEPAVSADGRSFTLMAPLIAPLATHHLRYVAEIKPGSAQGDVVNSIQAFADGGQQSNRATASVNIARDTLASRMTIVGRVTDGSCGAADAAGVMGVRILLEDGSYAVTDSTGRYHFDGLLPVTHVAQVDEMTLPPGRTVADCTDNTASAGRALSRFVTGSGGGLKRVDFVLKAGPVRARISLAPARAQPATDAEAAGAGRDWLAGESTPGIAWLFPAPEYNPRAPLVRVAIKHLRGQKITLLADGRPVDPVAFDGTVTSATGDIAVSAWRGISIEGRTTRLTAEVRNADGTLAETLRREVHYGTSAIHAEIVRDRSVLIADGVTRPVIAVRLTDRDGRPVHHGLTGDFELPVPYFPAVEADAQQARQLAGLERAKPFWRVEGDDGVAYIALEPTTASGSVNLRFRFRDGTTELQQRVDTWLDPGDRPWTIVGLAEGSVGFELLESKSEKLTAGRDKLLTDGRVALYAKGRVRGKWLMTLAYDTDKDPQNTRFGGTLDPDTYYTIYADRSERRYDASSIRKLYLRLERPQFYALFGDYETGIDEPRLARYVRAFNGAKAEFRGDHLAANAFAADTPNTHQHVELQGNGLSGPYLLNARDIVANSERITLEVRDRLRADRIVDRRLLQRYSDYTIDYGTGSVRFRDPILSRDVGLNPQFLVVDFEVDGIASRSLNAGGRVTLRTSDATLQVGATAIHDADDTQETNLVGADVRYRPGAGTEVRAELAVSDNRAKLGAARASAGTTTAWLVEAEHHDAGFDVLAYASERPSGFGVGQVTGADNGTRKIGFDTSARLADPLTLSASGWLERYLDTGMRRIAGRVLAEYRGRELTTRAGLTVAHDRLADGSTASSTLLHLGATKQFLDNRLELDALSDIALAHADSIDFPAQYRLSARYAVSPDVHLTAAYDIADGEQVRARTARIGFDIAPWAGARIALSGNAQDLAELGRRSFAAYGLSQSLVLDSHWSVDVTLDGNRTLGGINPARVLNPLHPVASGGFIGGGGLTEDFTAATAGATYRAGRWSATARGEWRRGEADDRYGITAAALRQLGDGSTLGGAATWYASHTVGGVWTGETALQLSWAHRPDNSRWSWLEKLELRDDRITGPLAVGGALPVAGGSLLPVRSQRAINSLSVNYADHAGVRRGWEASLFVGSRYASEALGAGDIGGISGVVGADVRLDLAPRVDVGFAGTARVGLDARSVAWSGGPTVGVSPFTNGWVQLGWNAVGFQDRDFEDDRYSRSGPYATMRLKFDQTTLARMGRHR